MGRRGTDLLNEWLRPKLMVFKSDSSTLYSSSNGASCDRIPRNRSAVVESETTLMPSFLEMAPAAQ